MSTKKEKDQAKSLLTPLKESEAGQIEGGFSDVSGISPDEEALNLALCNPNISCKPSTTAPA